MFFPTLYKFYPDLILIYLDEIRINWAQNQDKIKIKGHGRASTTLTKKNVIWTLSEAKDPNRKNFWRNTLCQRQTIVHVLECTTYHQLLTQALIYDVQKLHTHSSSSWPRVSTYTYLSRLSWSKEVLNV